MKMLFSLVRTLLSPAPLINLVFQFFLNVRKETGGSQLHFVLTAFRFGSTEPVKYGTWLNIFR